MARGRAAVRVAAGVGILALAGVGVYVAIQKGVGPLSDPEGCSATVGDHSVAMSIEQAENASTIASVAIKRELPARAITIAIATAYQESKLRNLEGGDRDSIGLFQQRPSQGWGKPAQLNDPVYASNAFYDALVQVDGYETMPITEAAQAVQRSAFPDAYADHEADGRAIASALSGYSKAAFSCHIDAESASGQKLGADGLTRYADAVRADIVSSFGDLPMGGFEPGGVTSGHMSGSAHYEGRAIDVFFRPISAANKRAGWALGQYLVANAERLHIEHVIFDKQIWTASKSDEGWRDFTPPELTGNEDAATLMVLEHRDHVHVDVW